MLRVRTVTNRAASGLFWTLALLLLIAGNLVHAQTLEELQAAAKKRDPSAQYQLGRRYLLGIGVAADEKKGFKYLLDAADKGNVVEAIHLVGLCYATEVGVRKNEKLALKYYEKAATAGYAEAEFKLAVCYERGLLRLKPDETTAMKWYLAAAKQGLPMAQLKYAELVKKNADYASAAEWYRKAAEQGVIKAQIKIGDAYNIGQVPGGADLAEAYKWYYIAARLNGPEMSQKLESLDKLKKTTHYYTEAVIVDGKRRAEEYMKSHPELTGGQ